MPTLRHDLRRPSTATPTTACATRRLLAIARLAAALTGAAATCAAQAAAPQIAVDAQTLVRGTLVSVALGASLNTPFTLTGLPLVSDSNGNTRDWVGCIGVNPGSTTACPAWDRNPFTVVRATPEDPVTGAPPGFDLAVGVNALRDQMRATYRISATIHNDTGAAFAVAPRFHVTGAEVRFGANPSNGNWTESIGSFDATVQASVQWFDVNYASTTYLGDRTIAYANADFDRSTGPIGATAYRASPLGGMLPGYSDSDQDFGIALARLPDFAIGVDMGEIPAGATWKIVYDLSASVAVQPRLQFGNPTTPTALLTAFIGDPFSVTAPAGALPSFDLNLPSPVPEPAAWGMLLAGLALVGARARRPR